MRQFAVIWAPQASLEVLEARGWLGPGRAVDLDEELERVRERISVHPEIGAPVKVRREWSHTVRRVILSHNPYHLYYRVNLEAERVVLISLWHERRRPLKL